MFCVDVRNGFAMKLYEVDCQQSGQINNASAIIKTFFPMPKIPDCEVCLLCAHAPSLVCAVHPYGQNSDFCPDFRPDPDSENKRFQNFLGLQSQQLENSDEPFSNPFSLDSNEAQWEPEGASYYNGELILQPKHQRTREEQLWLLEHHPMFTGRCPSCGAIFDQDYQARVHWDCECGWMDDSI